MATLRYIGIIIMALLLAACGKTQQRMTLIDDDWEFRMAGDSLWRSVDLPHDWSVECDFDSLAPASNDGGYLSTGKGEYMRTINVGKVAKDKLYSLLFEGSYMNTKVYLNGHEAGGWPYGYSSFKIDLTPYLQDGDNQLLVEVDNSQQKNCRWYSGSGLYRHVWLTITDKTYIDPWSIAISTPSPNEKEAKVDLAFQIVNASSEPRYVEAVIDICRYDSILAHDSFELEISDTIDVRTSLRIDNPALWCPDSPSLYQASISLSDRKGIVDKWDQSFGIREFEFDAKEGLKLNGTPLVLNGGCVHHDNGIIGAASFDAAERRKVELLKKAGFNAVRTSHNPPAPSFLDECDRQGIIVIDEAFDGWREAKTPNDYSILFDDWAKLDLKTMITRDRCHPSIMAWSIGNEILERKSPQAVEIAHQLAQLCRELDPTRPVTQALASWDADWAIYDPLAAEHDIVGYNYMIHKAEKDHKRVPKRVMWQTESYPRDAFKNWTKVNDLPYVIGDFVWTAIDYLGESGIGRHYYDGESEGEHFHRNQWPWHGALCGDIDLVGARKPISYYREMLYSDSSMLSIAVREPNGYKGEIKETMWGTYPMSQTWNWAGHEGQPIQVVAFTKADSVRLWLNDSIVGKAAVGRNTAFMATFTIPYQPGILRAEDSNGLTQKLITAGAPAGIRLSADKETLRSDNQDLAFVIAELIDSVGNVVPDSNKVISFELEGHGKLLSTGSADVKDPNSYSRPSRLTYQGRALAVIRAGKKEGQLILKASTADGLKSEIALTSKK